MKAKIIAKEESEIDFVSLAQSAKRTLIPRLAVAIYARFTVIRVH